MMTNTTSPNINYYYYCCCCCWRRWWWWWQSPRLSMWKRPRTCSKEGCSLRTAAKCHCLPASIFCYLIIIKVVITITIEIMIIMTVINTLVRKSSSVWTVSISTRRFILCRQSIGLEGELYGDDVESWLNVEIRTILMLATTIMRATTMKVTTVIMMVNTKQWWWWQW